MLVLQIAAGIVLAFAILFTIAVVLAIQGCGVEPSPERRYARAARDGRYLPSDARTRRPAEQ
jgi:hypothetical protein